MANRCGVYGPGTWYHPDGAVADTVRQQQFPIVGDRALTAECGIYSIVDHDPLPLNRWLPEFANWVGAPRYFGLI
jgi:2-alkyl-3-oxoalkanoate reductase